MTTPQQCSLANKAVYYFDLYTLHGRPDDLAAASAFMADYRKLGGEEYTNVERCIRNASESTQEEPQ